MSHVLTADSTGARSSGVSTSVAISIKCARNVHYMYKFSSIKLIAKVFKLFCRGFGNVVNHAFLVQISLAKNAVGVTFFACIYEG